MPRGKKNASAEVETSAAEPVPVYAVPAEPPAAGPPGEPGVLAPSDGEELEALRPMLAEMRDAFHTAERSSSQRKGGQL